MLPTHLLTVTNDYLAGRLPIAFEEDVDAIPFNPMPHLRYVGRYISTGPDAAIALTRSGIECFVDGEPCKTENAFTKLVGGNSSHLRGAWEDNRLQDDDTVILTGRWHRPEADRGPFDEPPLTNTGRFNIYVIHVVNPEGSVTSKKFDQHILEDSSVWSDISIPVMGDINTCFLAELHEHAETMLETGTDYGLRTPFGIMLADGVAWLPSDPGSPVIFSTRPRSDEDQRLHELSLEVRTCPSIKSYEVFVDGEPEGVYEAGDKRWALDAYAIDCGYYKSMEQMRLTEDEDHPVESYYRRYQVVEIAEDVLAMRHERALERARRLEEAIGTPARVPDIVDAGYAEFFALQFNDTDWNPEYRFFDHRDRESWRTTMMSQCPDVPDQDGVLKQGYASAWIESEGHPSEEIGPHSYRLICLPDCSLDLRYIRALNREAI